MKISRVGFENFGPFHKLDLPLWSPESQSGVTIFTGNNGSGKSSILEGITCLLGRLVARIRSERNQGSPVSELKIANDADYANLSISINASDKAFSWNLAKGRPGKKRRRRAT